MSNETKKQIEEISNIDTAEIAAEIDDDVQQDEIVTLPNGNRVRFRSVAPDLLRKVQEKIKDPVVPMTAHPNDPERQIENPHHPDYIAALEVAKEKREDAVINAMMLRGIELVDGMPANEDWMEDLVFLEVLSEEQIEDASDKLKEIWYKRFIAIDTYGFNMLMKRIGLTEEMVAQSRKSFQRN